MPSVQGAIDYTHISISKPAAYPEDYWYHKTGAYWMVSHAVVDANKLFTSVYVGLPRSVNDQRVLRRSGQWQRVVQRGLMNVDSGYQDGIPPYLLEDKGYPLMNWIIVPFKSDGQPRSLAETYFNKRYRQGRNVVENAFGLFKENWHEMGKRTDLHVILVPDVFYCYCILHNLTIKQGTIDVQELLRRIRAKAQEEVKLVMHSLPFVSRHAYNLSRIQYLMFLKFISCMPDMYASRFSPASKNALALGSVVGHDKY
jgi:hypothetical protein